eukprot:scpid46706/ scgid22714/ 
MYYAVVVCSHSVLGQKVSGQGGIQHSPSKLLQPWQCVFMLATVFICQPLQFAAELQYFKENQLSCQDGDRYSFNQRDVPTPGLGDSLLPTLNVASSQNAHYLRPPNLTAPGVCLNSILCLATAMSTAGVS